MSKKSSVVFLHDQRSKSISNGKKLVTEEYIIHGDKGLLIKYYHKDGDNTEKIIITKKGDNYLLKTDVNGTKEEKELSKDAIIKEITKNKNLTFALQYVKSQSQSGGKRGSRSGSRKGSRKGSRRNMKRGSRRNSKRGSKKGSKRGL